MAAPPPPPPDSSEFSSSATVTTFPKALPLLRIPIKSEDNPTLPPYLLAFNSPQSWSASYNSCVSQINQQCQAGARIGCSLSASNKCKTPWWKLAFGVSKQDFAQRAICEEQEMEACLVAARDKCSVFSKDKCLPAFMDARVVVHGHGFVQWKELGKLIGIVCRDRKIMVTERVEAEKTLLRIKTGLGMSICRGEDLMASQFSIQKLHQ